MAANRPSVYDNQFFNAGVPAAGFKLYTYDSGTTTPKTTYTDQAGTIPNTNPITLDAQGMCELWLGTGEYTLALYTGLIGSGGALVNTWDDVSGATTGADLDALRADLASTSDAAKGAALVGVKLNYAAAAGRLLHLKLNEWVSAGDFSGVDTSGATDSTTGLNAAFAAVGTGTLVMTGVFKVSNTLTVSCNTVMQHGSHIAPVSMPSGAAVFDVTERTRHEGVRIEAVLATDPANGTIGFNASAFNANRSTFKECSAINCKYGFVIRVFSVLLLDCKSNSNTCNLSMSAASSGVQINDVHVLGGNYSGPLGNYAIKIGDPDFATTVAAGQPHGAGISLNGFAVDGGTIKVDSALNVSIGTGMPVYHENPASGTCVELGTAGQDDYVGNVTIGPCFYNGAKYAVFCNAGIKGLDVAPSTYTSVTKCALYVMTDIYPFTYSSGKSVSSFTLAPEVHTGRRHATYTAHDFGYVSLLSSGVVNGVQTVLNEPDWQLAQATWREGPTSKRSSPTEYGYGRRYKTPTTGIAGSLNSYLLTLTTTSDAKYFNGGDEYALSSGVTGGGIIDRVDYETGIVYLSDSTEGSPTSCQIAQNTAAWVSVTSTNTGAPPTTGSWVQGDYCDNTNKASGSPRGWDRVTTGSGNVSGTDWKTIGNLP